MSKPRITKTYALYDGRKKVYIGESNNLDRRAKEHETDGLKFSRIETTSRAMTKDGAMSKEAEQLKSYQRGHGRLPRYNDDPSG